MKISKTFRLSPEAVAILDKQENATAFLEERILGSTPPVSQAPPWVDIITGIDMINKKLGSLENRPGDIIQTPVGPSRVALVEELARTPQDVMLDIKETEKSRDEELKYCQDQEEATRIGLEAQELIDSLWKEYHELKANR